MLSSTPLIRGLAAGLLSLPLLAPADGWASQDVTPTGFEVLIEGVGLFGALHLPDGSTVPAPISPGLYLVSASPEALFVPGSQVTGRGLEALAERGDARPWIAELNAATGSEPARPFLHDEAFTVIAKPGDRLFIATMFAQSNDLFYAPDVEGIALFDAEGRPRAGEVTAELVLWDAGTEVNQHPGLGGDQAPRQETPDSGEAENGVVRLVGDGFTYPATATVIRITITPKQ